MFFDGWFAYGRQSYFLTGKERKKPHFHLGKLHGLAYGERSAAPL